MLTVKHRNRLPLNVNSSEVVEFLLKAGADVGLTDVLHNTPVHYLTAGQLTCGEHEYIITQTRTHQQYIRNTVGATTLSSVAAHGILNYANHERDISNADSDASREGFHSEQLIHDFSSSVVPWVLELHYIKTPSKTKIYCRKESAYVDCYGNTLNCIM